MGKSRIDIEIGTKGAPEAKRAIADVRRTAEEAAKEPASTSAAQAVHDLAAANRDSAMAAADAAGGTEKAERGTENFDRTAKKLVLSVLGGVNPALRGMADLSLDVVEGIGKLSTRLLAVTGIGAGIAAAFAIIAHAAGEVARRTREAQEAIDRMRRAGQQAAQEQLGRRESVAEASEKAGVLGVADQASRMAAALEARGVPADLARYGAVAQQVGTVGGTLTDEQTLQVIGAYLAGGRKAGLEGGIDKSRQSVANLLRSDPNVAGAALAAKLRDVGVVTRAKGAVPAPPPGEMEVSAALERLRESQLYNDQELALMEQVAMGRNLEDIPAQGWGGQTIAINRTNYERYPSQQRRARGFRAVGSSRTVGELLDALQTELNQQAAIEGSTPVEIERLLGDRMQVGPRVPASQADTSARLYTPDEMRRVEQMREQRRVDDVLSRLAGVLERLDRGGGSPVVVQQTTNIQHAYDLPGLQRSVPAPELMDGTVR